MSSFSNGVWMVSNAPNHSGRSPRVQTASPWFDKPPRISIKESEQPTGSPSCGPCRFVSPLLLPARYATFPAPLLSAFFRPRRGDTSAHHRRRESQARREDGRTDGRRRGAPERRARLCWTPTGPDAGFARPSGSDRGLGQLRTGQNPPSFMSSADSCRPACWRQRKRGERRLPLPEERDWQIRRHERTRARVRQLRGVNANKSGSRCCFSTWFRELKMRQRGSG